MQSSYVDYLLGIVTISSPGVTNYLSTPRKLLGRTMFSTSSAWRKSGAICSAVKPAMPHPMGVTRNSSSL